MRAFSDDENWRASVALVVEDICKRFEAAWRNAGPGDAPSVDAYLNEAPAAAAADVLAELLLLDLHYRRIRGQHPSRADYQTRFAEHSQVVERCVPDDRQHQLEMAQAVSPSLLGSVGPPTDISAPPAKPSPIVLPGYEILGELGRGGMGVVYKARQVGLQRVVALKMVLAGAHASPEAVRRFRAEAEAVARLHHPNIVAIHEIGESAGLPFFSLEFCSGGTLAGRLGGGPLAHEEAARVVWRLAEGLHAAHLAGVIHRDIKPANVLFDERNTPKLTDFGLAKLSDSQHTATEAIMGTPAYMSPEQAINSKACDARSDVYSLGAVLYECLAGRPLFRGVGVIELLEQVRTREPPSLSRLNPTVPRDLETICLKCLDKSPTRRYQTAAELAEDLSRWLRHEPIHARPASTLERAIKWARRRPAAAALVVGGAIAVVLLGALAVVASVGWRTASEALQEANDQKQRRALAQVVALRDAAPAAVPGILEALEESREDILPRLREAHQQERDPAKKARLALALLPVEPEAVRDEVLERMLTTEEPAESLLARDELRHVVPGLADILWARVDDPRSTPVRRFRALACVAALNPRSKRWELAGEEVVGHLLATNPLHLGAWVEAVRPVRDALLPHLRHRACDPGRPESERLLAAVLLGDFAADRPELLVGQLLESSPEQFALLVQRLRPHSAESVRLLRREIEREATAEWPLAKVRAGSPDALVVREVTAAGGMLHDTFAFARAMPLARVGPVAETLRPLGYRPIRVRPSDGLAAVVWARDGGDWRLAQGMDAPEVRRLDQEYRKSGLSPVDAAGYAVGSREARYAAVWGPGGKSTGSRLALGLTRRQHAALVTEMDTQWAFHLSTLHSFLLDGEPRFDSVWQRETLAWRVTGGWTVPALELLHAGRLQVDANLLPAERITGVPREAAMELCGAPPSGLAGLPWWSLYLSRRGVPETCRAGGVWNEDWSRRSRLVWDSDPARHLERCQPLAAAGHRPVALSVAEGVTASVWHQPRVTDEDRDALAQRQANAAIALMHLERADLVWPLLRHSPDPGRRSHLLHRMGPYGIEARVLRQRLEIEENASVRRALILALGDFTRDQIPTAEQKTLDGLLLAWYRKDPDAGVHGAIDWLLRHAHEGTQPRKINWGRRAELEQIDRELAGKTQPPDSRWLVSPSGQTMTLIPGPTEFVQGAPEDEPYRAPDEGHQRRRINRSFAIATREVTVRQFVAFMKAHPEARGFDYHKGISGDEECPVNRMSWYQAVQFCRWLSEQENVPPDQMCYPSVAEIEQVKRAGRPLRLPSDYLRRTGYRLPTESEWEFASRAGAATARPEGASAELLGRYAWYRENCAGVTWPVGQKRPNDLGLFDTLGNMGEWCQDTLPGRLGPSGLVTLDEEDNDEILTDRFRMTRGGAFDIPAKYLRCANRANGNPPGLFNLTQGLRVVRTWPLPPSR